MSCSHGAGGFGSPKLDRPEVIDFSGAQKDESGTMLGFLPGLFRAGLALWKRSSSGESLQDDAHRDERTLRIDRPCLRD